MRSGIILALILLSAILVAGLFSDNIKTYAVASINDNCEMGLCYGCVIDGIPCTCYSKECVCENRIVPISACINS
ncbi:hypothetical protein KY333_04760 [Candidatus Woesearchaeota archaeon]|nr:hypothetical protein [Candidatus Woesearchaeota archaeon]MBW2993824.1 hypothetical protein [Candidatus Woesearchaeota archaeon]